MAQFGIRWSWSFLELGSPKYWQLSSNSTELSLWHIQRELHTKLTRPVGNIKALGIINIGILKYQFEDCFIRVLDFECYQLLITYLERLVPALVVSVFATWYPSFTFHICSELSLQSSVAYNGINSCLTKLLVVQFIGEENHMYGILRDVQEMKNNSLVGVPRV